MSLDADVSLVPTSDLDLDEEIPGYDMDGSFTGEISLLSPYP